MSGLTVEDKLVIPVGRDVWECCSCRPTEAFLKRHPAFEDGQELAVFQVDGRTVMKVVPRIGPYVRACRVAIHPGYPVVAVRGAFGLGMHWDTSFFAIKQGHLIRMGRAPATNSHGPVLWHGRKDIWAFDDTDRYAAMDNPHRALHILLMRVGEDGRLHRWKILRHAKHPLPITVRTPELE